MRDFKALCGLVKSLEQRLMLERRSSSGICQQLLNIILQVLAQVPVLWIWDNVEPVAGFPEGAESQWTAAEQRELRDFLQQLQQIGRAHV